MIALADILSRMSFLAFSSLYTRSRDPLLDVSQILFTLRKPLSAAQLEEILSEGQ